MIISSWALFIILALSCFHDVQWNNVKAAWTVSGHTHTDTQATLFAHYRGLQTWLELMSSKLLLIPSATRIRPGQRLTKKCSACVEQSVENK